MSVVTKDTIQPSSGQALTIKDEGGTASITVATNGEATFAENIKVTNGKGIDFSAVSGSTSGSTSAILDDYEEGTWTPVVKHGTAVISGFTSGDYSHTYTRIGNVCHLRFTYADVTTSGTISSGNITIEGIPYVPVGYYAIGSIWANYGGTKFTQAINNGQLFTGDSKIYIKYQIANSNWGDSTFSSVGASSYGGLSITYFVA